MTQLLPVLLELIILFIILPLLYFFDWIPVNQIIPLILLFGYCVGVLSYNRQFKKEEFKMNADWEFLLLRFFIVVVVFTAMLALFAPHLLFSNLNDHPKFWTIVIITYPPGFSLSSGNHIQKILFHLT